MMASFSSSFSSSRSPSVLLLFLHLLPSLGWLAAPVSGSPMNHDIMTSSDSSLRGPHLTSCKSTELETFRCWWSAGSFRNLSEPGALRVFYQTKNTNNEWRECPEYSSVVENECYFNKNHTVIWTKYYVELRSQNQNVTYDRACFTVEDIVYPDPPVALNWTLLNVSISGLNYDIMAHWKAPPSADVELGWIKLDYEAQYRKRNDTHWNALDVVRQTRQTIYGLHTGEDYEVRVHCTMSAFSNFGEFSETVFVFVPGVPSKESTFPVTLVLIFGVVGVIILFMLIIFSQQQRLMVILLPPIPVPKIKGIDPELLKKGNLEELNFILSGRGMGGLHSYPTDLYQDDPWVEFIEVEAEEAEPGEKEDSRSSDTQRLLAPRHPGHHTHLGCSHTLSITDDDSGRASCYDPEVPEQEALLLMATLLPSQPDKGEPLLGVQARSSPPGPEVFEAPAPGQQAPEGGERPLVQTQSGGPPSWINKDFYAQVSDVTPSGAVVLSPGQQPRSQENAPTAVESKKKEKEEEEEEEEGGEGRENEVERRTKRPQFHLLVVDPEGCGYTTESSARYIGAPTLSLPGEVYQTLPPQPAETKPQQEAFLPPCALVGDYQSPYILPESPPAHFLSPVSDYTVVQEVDCQHSLLLNPPSPQTPPPCPPQHPTKPLPAMPIGYLSPDLLSNRSP